MTKPIPDATAKDIARFMKYVDVLPNGCWFWTGGRSRGKGNKKWYGSFYYQGRTVRAHRFACEQIAKKALLTDHHRDHTCRFSLCVNPDHLEIVHKVVNQSRKLSPGIPVEVEYNPDDGHIAVYHNGQIDWDRLQAIKDEYFGPDAVAIEVYPPASELVNNINCRHIWKLKEGVRWPNLMAHNSDDFWIL